MTHFSDLIGATHSPDFAMWDEGMLSSYGMQQMAEYGIVRELENELRNQVVYLEFLCGILQYLLLISSHI